MYGHDDAFVAWGNYTLKSELYINEEKLKSKMVDSGYKLPDDSDQESA